MTLPAKAMVADAPTSVVQTLLTVSLIARPATAGAIRLTWQVFGATSCTASADPAASDWTGPKSASQTAATFSQTLAPLSQPTTFVLDCLDAAGHTARATAQSTPIAPRRPAAITASPPPAPISSAAVPVSSQPAANSAARAIGSGALGATILSLASLGAFGLSTTGSGVPVGLFLLNSLTMLAVIGNALLETLGLRPKRYPWGTVFDVRDDQPLALAIVRLKSSTGRLVETRVTDQAGRVGFLPQPGDYHLEASKLSFSPAPASRAAGSRYQPVLDGTALHIPDASTAVQANLPMQATDAQATGWNPHVLQMAHFPLLVLAVGLASLETYLRPDFLNFLLLAVPLLVILGEWLIIHPRSFGVVTDAAGQPVAGLVLQLVNSDTHKVLATQVTDPFGRYNFLVRPGVYHLRLGGQPDTSQPAQLAGRQFVISKKIGGLIAPSIRLADNH